MSLEEDVIQQKPYSEYKISFKETHTQTHFPSIHAVIQFP